MQEFILFLMTFIFIFILYQIFLIRPLKKRGRKGKKGKKEDRELIEIRYLIKKYKLDVKKVNYKQLLQIVALVSSFDISLVVSIIFAVNNFLLEIVIGFFATFLIILISYHLVYLFYKKKGMICNE